jgi:dihydropteroate synthase
VSERTSTVAGRRAAPEPLLMGILNVTPDSFSDAGRFLDPDAAVEHGRRLVADGADVVDVGGESTRPGAEPVSAEIELERTIPVVERLAAGRDTGPPGVRVSIDTTKAEVATAAIGAGARIVNDVSAFRFDPEMAGLVASSGANCVLMHMLGEPRTMQEDPRYADVVSEVKAFLEERLAFAVGEGVHENHVWLDPGIGFGKTVDHNLELLARLDELVAIGRPVVIGTSRKSFLGGLTGRPVEERLAGTIASNVLALAAGARVFRVHDVAEVADALAVARAALSGRAPEATEAPTR